MNCVDVPLECQSLRRELRLELRGDRGDRHFPAPELNQQLTRMVVKQPLGADAEGMMGLLLSRCNLQCSARIAGLLTILHLLADLAQFLLDHHRATP